MSEMISVAEGFQYSVNIAYDLHADDMLEELFYGKKESSRPLSGSR